MVIGVLCEIWGWAIGGFICGWPAMFELGVSDLGFVPVVAQRCLN